MVIAVSSTLFPGGCSSWPGLVGGAAAWVLAMRGEVSGDGVEECIAFGGIIMTAWPAGAESGIVSTFRVSFGSCLSSLPFVCLDFAVSLPFLFNSLLGMAAAVIQVIGDGCVGKVRSTSSSC